MLLAQQSPWHLVSPSLSSHSNYSGHSDAPSSLTDSAFMMGFSIMSFASIANSAGTPAVCGENLRLLERIAHTFTCRGFKAGSHGRGHDTRADCDADAELAQILAIGRVMEIHLLLALYATWPFWPSKAATEATLMIIPRSPSPFGSF